MTNQMIMLGGGGGGGLHIGVWLICSKICCFSFAYEVLSELTIRVVVHCSK